MTFDHRHSFETAGTIFFVGTAFAGQTIRVRFRIGTDETVGDVGWELNNLAFSGITNTPFAVLVEDTGVCRPKKHSRR